MFPSVDIGGPVENTLWGDSSNSGCGLWVAARAVDGPPFPQLWNSDEECSMQAWRHPEESLRVQGAQLPS